MSNLTTAVILAGGEGSRISEITNLPKCLIEINGMTLLERQIRLFEDSGYKKIFLLLGIKANPVLDWLDERKNQFKIEIKILLEDFPRGTGGAIALHLEHLPEEFLVTYGDLYLDTNLKFMGTNFSKSSELIRVFYHASNHMSDSDVVELDENSIVTDIYPKNGKRPIYVRNQCLAGVSALKKSVFIKKPDKENFDLENELISLFVRSKDIRGIKQTGIVKDLGTKDRITRGVSTESFREDQKIVFLDRDGVLIEDTGHVSNYSQVKLLDGVAEALCIIREKGYKIIVVTNQPVIARGDATHIDVNNIHGLIDNQLNTNDAFIDDYIYCPHYPQAGFENEVLELKIDCDCRKPKIGMFKRVQEIRNIAIKQSWMVGDRESDIVAGNNFGLQTCLLITPGNSVQVDSDAKFDSLLNFARFLT